MDRIEVAHTSPYTQLELDMRPAAALDLITENELTVLIDKARPASFYNTSWVGQREVKGDVDVQLVHIISARAGGEIRGYVLAAGRLHLRLPCYSGHWPEMDAAAVYHCGATEVVPYKLGAGGMQVE